MTDILFGTQVRREFFIGGLKKPDARDQRVAAGCTSRKLCVEVRSAAQKYATSICRPVIRANPQVALTLRAPA
jgi:hypothetical protein